MMFPIKHRQQVSSLSTSFIPHGPYQPILDLAVQGKSVPYSIEAPSHDEVRLPVPPLHLCSESHHNLNAYKACSHRLSRLKSALEVLHFEVLQHLRNLDLIDKELTQPYTFDDSDILLHYFYLSFPEVTPSIRAQA